MSDVDVDKSNVDAMYWAEKFCETMSEQHWEYEDIDVGLMLGWFANYRFAVADKLEAELDTHLSELKERRERIYEEMLEWRGIYTSDGDPVCDDCAGSGVKMYGDTSTWRGGYGGQALTNDVCDKCWGRGRPDKPWANLRRIDSWAEDKKRITELEQQLTALREAAMEFFRKEMGGAVEAYAAKDRLRRMAQKEEGE